MRKKKKRYRGEVSNSDIHCSRSGRLTIVSTKQLLYVLSKIRLLICYTFVYQSVTRILGKICKIDIKFTLFTYTILRLWTYDGLRSLEKLSLKCVQFTFAESAFYLLVFILHLAGVLPSPQTAVFIFCKTQQTSGPRVIPQTSRPRLFHKPRDSVFSRTPHPRTPHPGPALSTKPYK